MVKRISCWKPLLTSNKACPSGTVGPAVFSSVLAGVPSAGAVPASVVATASLTGGACTTGVGCGVGGGGASITGSVLTSPLQVMKLGLLLIQPPAAIDSSTVSHSLSRLRPVTVTV